MAAALAYSSHRKITAPTLDERLAEIAAQVPKWHADALSAEVGGDLWHVDKGESTEPAKEVCSRCPVVAECLQWALDTGEAHGIYGGLSERQRTRLRNQKAAA